MTEMEKPTSNEMLPANRAQPSTANLSGTKITLWPRLSGWFPALAVGVVLVGGIGTYAYLSNPWRNQPPQDLGKPAATTGRLSDAKLGAAGDGGASPVATVTPLPPALDPVPTEPPKVDQAPLAGQPLPPPPVTTPIQPAGPVRNRYDAPMFGGKGGDSSGGGFAPGLNAATPQNKPAGVFDGNLNGTATPKAVASMLGNRSLTLAKGASIKCVLNTALQSGIAGMTTCTVPKAVFSDDGKVQLIEAGTTVTGEFNGQVKTGQSRFAVLWTRLKTPQGVIVNLDSPGADELGRTGLTGDVDKHWWERIGGAFMLSLVQDAIGYAATRGAGNNNGATQMYFQNTQQAGENMANTILKETINIPPTISKNQGDLITIYVARDIDFSAVYQTRGGQ